MDEKIRNNLQDDAIKRASNHFDEAEKVNQAMKKHFEQALKEIQKQITDFYMRYASESGTSYTEAQKLLSKVEIKGFRADLEKYADAIINGEDAELIARLNAVSIKERITRLEALQTELLMECAKLGFVEQDMLAKHLGQTYELNYYQSIFQVQHALGWGVSFATLDATAIREAIMFPWSGSNFSELIWNNRSKLVMELKNTVTQGLIQGSSIQMMANRISKAMDNSYQNSLRLVRTETAQVVNRSTIEGYRESGVVEKLEFLAVLDGSTSNICKEIALSSDRIFGIDEAKVGVNVPPLHPNCRSAIAPYFGEDDDVEKPKGAFGVQKDETFDDWRSKHTNEN